MNNHVQTPFKKRLEEGIETKMILLSHNSVWTSLQICARKYENFELEVFGDGTSYISNRLSSKGYILADCDFIIFYSSSFYSQDELAYLKRLANYTSADANKRVTVGYSYVLPKAQRKNEEITDEIKLYSVKNNLEEEKNIDALEEICFGPMSLADFVTEYHDNLEKKENTEKNITGELAGNGLEKVLSIHNKAQ